MRFGAFEEYTRVMGLTMTVTPEPQNSDYESGLARIDDEQWHIRTARTTSVKPGGFVAFWRRSATGETAPFTDEDRAAGLLVFVEQHDHRGLFRITGDHLSRLGITAGKSAGMRGFRVYPDWCAGLNSQAARTQRAQAPAFERY
jgi:hypothetical protein